MSKADCDEAISSANLVFEMYSENLLNINLAITTNQEISKEDKLFINKVKENGGTISNHSHSHQTYWGLIENNFNDDFKKSKKLFMKFLTLIQLHVWHLFINQINFNKF